MSDLIAKKLAAFSKTAAQPSVLIDENIVLAVIEAVNKRHPKGGKTEIFRVLHLIFGYNGGSIVKTCGVKPPQQVHNALGKIKPEVKTHILQTYKDLKDLSGKKTSKKSS